MKLLAKRYHTCLKDVRLCCFFVCFFFTKAAMFSPVAASERGADGFVAEAAGDQQEKIFLD